MKEDGLLEKIDRPNTCDGPTFRGKKAGCVLSEHKYKIALFWQVVQEDASCQLRKKKYLHRPWWLYCIVIKRGIWNEVCIFNALCYLKTERTTTFLSVVHFFGFHILDKYDTCSVQDCARPSDARLPDVESTLLSR